MCFPKTESPRRWPPKREAALRALTRAGSSRECAPAGPVPGLRRARGALAEGFDVLPELLPGPALGVRQAAQGFQAAHASEIVGLLRDGLPQSGTSLVLVLLQEPTPGGQV